MRIENENSKFFTMIIHIYNREDNIRYSKYALKYSVLFQLKHIGPPGEMII